MKLKRYAQFMAQAAALRKAISVEFGNGKSQAELAKKYGISRQRVHQIVNYRAHSARKAVGRAVRLNKLPPANTMRCKDCGKKATEYDHRDYKKPLEVEAVCKSCNSKRGAGVNGHFCRGAA